MLLSCSNQRANEPSTNEENQIELTTIQDKKRFLKQILKDDQAVRDGQLESSLIATYGYNSVEHKEYIENQWKQDEVNLHKIELYLKKYGYPKKVLFGKDERVVPWLVIHHSTNISVRNRYFDILYNAYKDGNIDQTAFSMYLNRTYKFTFREDFDIKGNFSSDIEISRLIEELGLEQGLEKE